MTGHAQARMHQDRNVHGEYFAATSFIAQSDIFIAKDHLIATSLGHDDFIASSGRRTLHRMA
jgi:hypothetical protein